MKRRSVYFLILLLHVFCKSCNKNAGQELRTLSLLDRSKNIFSNIECDQFKIDLSKFPGKKYSVNEVIDKEMFHTDFSDGWGNPILCMHENSTMHIWSTGPNKIDDNRKGDDLVVSFQYKPVYIGE